MRTMILVIVAAFAAVCGADKLNKVYLPPVSAKTAGGSAESLQPPLFRTSEQGFQGVPSGGYTNDYQGVIVDAVNPGTRASGLEQTGLGGPRSSYGSGDSKVGDAAFRASVSNTADVASSRIAPGFESFVTSGDKTGQANFRLANVFGDGSSAEGFLSKDKKSNTLKFNNDVGLDKYSYGYKTDNGIAVEEDGVDAHGAKAQGGYAFKADDGKVYEVTYTAGKDGYKPQGAHLPTPPPIPQSILVSLEKNAKEEAAGVVDDGSYDAQKYNDESDYSSNNGNKYNDKLPSIGGKDATASGTFVTQNDQPSSSASGSSKYQSGSQFGSSSVSSTGIEQTHGGYKPFGVSGSKTESRFGTLGFGSQSSFNKESQNRGTFGKTPFGTPGYSSAFSSAVSTGSGSATAFAQSGSGPESKYSTKQPFASNYQGSDSTVNPNTPSLAIASAFATNSPFKTQSQYNGIPQSEATASVEEGEVSSFASAQNGPGNSGVSSFGQSLNGNSDATSATASASVSPQSSTFDNQQQQFGSFQAQSPVRPGQFTSGSGSGSTYNGYQSPNSNKKPGQYTQSQFGSSFGNNKPTSSFSSFNQKPTKQPSTELVTPYAPNEKPSKPSSSFDSTSFNTQTSNQYGSAQSAFASTTKPQTSQFGSSNFQSSYSQGNSGQYNSNKFGASQSTGTSHSSSTPKPFYQEQGKDSSYYYNQPNKPFVIPKPQTTSTQFGSQFSGNSQPNFPDNTVSPTLATQTGQYQTTTSFNGVTQAEVSSFSSSSPTTSTDFGSKPSGVSQLSTQTGTTLLDRRPLVQSQSTSSSSFSESSLDGTVSSSQENEGTIYEYNKPAEVLPTPKPEQNKPSQVATGSGFGSSQFGSHLKPSGNFQQTQLQTTFGSQSTGSLNQKPTTSTFGQKPFSSAQQSQFGAATESHFGQKPSFVGSSFPSPGQPVQFSQTGTQQNQFSTSQVGQKPTSTQTGFGSNQVTQGQFTKPFSSSQSTSGFQENQYGTSSTLQFGQKPQTTLGSSFTSNKYSETQAFQTSPFGSKPFGSSQAIGSSFQQSQQDGHQFGVKPQTGSSFSTSTASQGQSSLSSQSEVDSSQTGSSSFQQNQLNSQFNKKPSSLQTTVPAFGQKPLGSSQSTSSTSQQFGSSTQFSHSSQNTGQQTGFGSLSGSQFGQKPSDSSFTTDTGFNQNQATPTGSQKPQSTFQQSQISSSTQQSQFGSAFSQKPSTGSSFGVGALSQGQSIQTTQKPFGSVQTTFQQNQFGSSGLSFGQKPQTTQGSTSTTISQEQTLQTTQFGQAAFGSQSTGFGNQQSQSGSSTSQQGGKEPETSFGTVFGTSQGQAVQKPQIGQKPFGSQTTTGTFQQNQFGSSGGSHFGQKPSQGTLQSTGPVFTTQFPVTSSKPQFGSQTQKPFGSSQTAQGTGFQQFGSSESHFGQKPLANKVQSSGSVLGTQNSQSTQSQFGTQTQKPFGTNFQQNGYGQKPASSANAFASTTGTGTQFGIQSFGSQPNKGFSSTIGSQTQKPFGSSQTQQSQYTQSSTQFGQSSQSQTLVGTEAQKPFGSISSQTGAYKPQKPFGGSYTQTGAYQPQKPFGSISSETGVFKPQKPFGSSYTQTGAYQPQKHSESTSTQTGAYQPQKPFGSTLTQTGTYQPQKPSKNTSTQTGAYQPEKPFGSTFTQTGTYQPQKPLGSTSTQTGAYQPQKPFGSTFTQTGTNQSQKPFGSTFTQTGTNQPQKPLGSTSTQTGAYQPEEPSESLSTQTGTYQPQKPFGSTFTQTGAYQPQKPFGSTFTQTGAYKPQKPFGSTFTQTGAYQPQKPFGSTFTQTGAYKPQKPFGSTFTQTGTNQPQKPLGSTSAQTGAYQPEEPSESTSTQTGAYQTQKPFGSAGSSYQTHSESLDKTQPTQSSIQVTSGSISSAQSSTQLGQPLKPFGNYGSGYLYQKPQSTFSSQFGTQTSRPTVDQKPQQTQANAFSSTSQSGFGSQTFKPFGFGSTLSPNYQTTIGSAQSTDKPEYVSTPVPQFTGLPVSSTTAQASYQPIQTQYGQTSKPFGASAQGSIFEQAQSTASSSGYGIQSAQSIAQTSQGTKFGSQPTIQSNLGAFGVKPISAIAQSSVGSAQGQSSTGIGEQFGGPRDPPSFDKTGYHY